MDQAIETAKSAGSRETAAAVSRGSWMAHGSLLGAGVVATLAAAVGLEALQTGSFESAEAAYLPVRAVFQPADSGLRLDDPRHDRLTLVKDAPAADPAPPAPEPEAADAASDAPEDASEERDAPSSEASHAEPDAEAAARIGRRDEADMRDGLGSARGGVEGGVGGLPGAPAGPLPTGSQVMESSRPGAEPAAAAEALAGRTAKTSRRALTAVRRVSGSDRGSRFAPPALGSSKSMFGSEALAGPGAPDYGGAGPAGAVRPAYAETGLGAGPTGAGASGSSGGSSALQGGIGGNVGGPGGDTPGNGISSDSGSDNGSGAGPGGAKPAAPPTPAQAASLIRQEAASAWKQVGKPARSLTRSMASRYAPRLRDSISRLAPLPSRLKSEADYFRKTYPDRDVREAIEDLRHALTDGKVSMLGPLPAAPKTELEKALAGGLLTGMRGAEAQVAKAAQCLKDTPDGVAGAKDSGASAKERRQARACSRRARYLIIHPVFVQSLDALEERLGKDGGRLVAKLERLGRDPRRPRAQRFKDKAAAARLAADVAAWRASLVGALREIRDRGPWAQLSAAERTRAGQLSVPAGRHASRIQALQSRIAAMAEKPGLNLRKALARLGSAQGALTDGQAAFDAVASGRPGIDAKAQPLQPGNLKPSSMDDGQLQAFLAVADLRDAAKLFKKKPSTKGGGS